MNFVFPFEMTNFVLSVDSFSAPLLTITDKRNGIIHRSNFANISMRFDAWMKACFDGVSCPFTDEDADEFYLIVQLPYPTQDIMLWHYAQDLAYQFLRYKNLRELLQSTRTEHRDRAASLE